MIEQSKHESGGGDRYDEHAFLAGLGEAVADVGGSSRNLRNN